MSSYKYFAFISYSTHDSKWGKKVQQKLENYRLSTTLCRKYGWKRRPLRPIFFAPTDIQPGELNEELKTRLEHAKNLVIICSPSSAKSYWVGKEIEYFHSLGREKNIYFFIIDGTPNSGNIETECIHNIVKELNIPEILGVNIHEKIYLLPWLNRERAYIQLITKLLGIEYDEIWKRHRRKLIFNLIKSFGVLFSIIVLLWFVWLYNIPTNVSISLNETSIQNKDLPLLSDAKISLKLDNELKSGYINSIYENITFTNIPNHCLGKNAHITFEANNFLKLDTCLSLTENIVLNISRDPLIFGNVKFRLWNPHDERWVDNVKITIDEKYEFVTDKNGLITFFVPLGHQKTAYSISSPAQIEQDSIYMPCDDNTIILMR